MSKACDSSRGALLRRVLSLIIPIAAIPAVILLSATLFRDRSYMFTAVFVVLLSCLPFLLDFERGSGNAARAAMLAVLVAASVGGRCIFAAIPHFKPVAAVVIITGIYLGPSSGFLCGALTAILSNIVFGQGSWTPFQMFAWGIVGLLAGLSARLLKKSVLLTAGYGALAGILFSLLMDVYTVLWWGNGFSLSRYLTAAVPVTATYAVSNALFLLLLTRPIGLLLERVTKKHGI